MRKYEINKKQSILASIASSYSTMSSENGNEIRPYYEDNQAVIFHGDSLTFLPKLSMALLDEVEIILTDPDYNAKDIGPNKRSYENGMPAMDKNSYRDFCFRWFEIACNVTQNIVFTPGIANTHFYPQPYWQICWHKPAAVSFNRVGGYNVWEPIFLYGKPMKRLGQDFIRCNTLNFKKGLESLHPCSKPLSLWRFLLSHTEGTVLDLFMGSGTTLVVAKDLGRKAIGIDIEEKYCEIAALRLQQQVLDFSECEAKQKNIEQNTGSSTEKQSCLTL